MRIALALAAVLAIPLGGGLARADEGARFDAVVADWLAGQDDMAVLAGLADLAASGDGRARRMLGAIEADAALRPEAVAELSRQERIALTRAPGGLSGTSWLVVAGETDAVARALVTAGFGHGNASPAEHRAALETLLDAGEAAAALQLLAIGYNQGGFGPDSGWTFVMELGGHPGLQGHGQVVQAMLRGYLANPNAFAEDQSARIAALDAALVDMSPDDRVLAEVTRSIGGSADADLVARVEAGLAGATLAAPLLAFCQVECPETALRCTRALAGAMGGMVGVVTLSPFETLVPSETYRQSPRFTADLRARLSASGPLIGSVDACSAAAVTR